VLAIVTIAFAIFAGRLDAQEGRFSLGALAGADVADQAGEDAFAPHDRIGFIGGATSVFRLSGRWSVQLDALYVQKGGRENNDSDPSDPENVFHVDYLEIPLLLKFSFSESGTRPAIYVGPSLDFELSCSYDVYPDGESRPAECADTGLQTKPVDFGITFGLDVEVPLGSGWLVVDGRGVVALDSLDDSEASLDYRNRILALMVGYRFTL
jgi:hypothetical protein